MFRGGNPQLSWRITLINLPTFCTLPSQSCLPTMWTICYNPGRYLGCLPVLSATPSDSGIAPLTTSCCPEPYPGVSIHISAYIIYHTYRYITQLICTYRYISSHIDQYMYHVFYRSVYIIYVSITQHIYVSVYHIMADISVYIPIVYI